MLVSLNRNIDENDIILLVLSVKVRWIFKVLHMEGHSLAVSINSIETNSQTIVVILLKLWFSRILYNNLVKT